MFKLVTGLFCVVSLSLSVPAHARVYKCKDVDGNITYSQTTCVASSEQKQMSSSRHSQQVDVETCRMLGKAAREVFSEIKRGKDSQAILNSYGGLGGITPHMLNLVNYVGSFRAHENISGQRVAQLSMSKCRSGGFGAISIDDIQFNDPYLAQQASVSRQRQQAEKQHQQLVAPDLISVNFRQTPLQEALRTVSKKAGVLFTIDPSVSGKVTLKMDNVPWPQVVSRLAIEHQLLMGQGINGVMISTMRDR